MISVRFILLVFCYSLCQAITNSGFYGDVCPVELSQKTSKVCQNRRYQLLQAQRRIYHLAPVIKGEPIRMLNMTFEQLLAVYQTHPFEMWEFNIYIKKTYGSFKIQEQWNKLNAGKDIQSFADFVKIFAFCRKASASFGDPFFKLPSDVEPFKDLITYWMQDKVFAEQRLAGLNPMTLMRVSPDRDNAGIKWKELKKTLNQEFDWDHLLIKHPKMPNLSLEKAISYRMVFVLRYPLLDHLPAMPDIMESRPYREMWKPTSPIALFAVHPYKRDNLVPIAIQMDVKSGSPVYTPKDKGLWMLAKLSVQSADLGYNQVAEHLAKTHLLMEPFCVSKDRQLSQWHPLHQILKYHCRGVTITDKLAFQILLAPNAKLHKLFPYGYLGAVSIALKAYRQTSWKDTDFLENIKRRGVERRSLHFLPYRDDGYILYSTIQKVATDYVKQYYKCDDDVENDYELQNFMNEVSADGIGSDGGLGNIKDLPRELTTVKSLVNFLTRFLWQISAHHAAVNYALADYGAFTLNMPTKLYKDSRAPDDVFSLFNYPNANISSEQGLLSTTLSNFRFDSLFDYGDTLPDKKGRRVISSWFYYLRRKVQPYIEWKNRLRLAKDHLTYPYLSPRWIPNGIQT